MQQGKRIAVARKNKRSRVPIIRKVAKSLVIVIDDHLPRLESEVGADIGVHARVAAQGKLGRVAVLAHDVQGIAILVLCVGIAEAATSKSATDGKLPVGWDRPTL